MYAGIPEMGLVDAWRNAPTSIEQLKLDGTRLCAGVGDIAKFFDQVRRRLLYRMAVVAGMPPMVLGAYIAYIGNLPLYDCLAGGVGRPHKGK